MQGRPGPEPSHSSRTNTIIGLDSTLGYPLTFCVVVVAVLTVVVAGLLTVFREEGRHAPEGSDATTSSELEVLAATAANTAAAAAVTTTADHASSKALPLHR
jgi:hypothetical protein